jgi:hypothetical protein
LGVRRGEHCIDSCSFAVTQLSAVYLNGISVSALVLLLIPKICYISVGLQNEDYDKDKINK